MDGALYKRAATTSPTFSLNDYDQNLDILHDSTATPRKMEFTFPGGDTTPADYAAIFTGSVVKTYQPIQDFALGYDVVVIKSCYPNANIASDAALEDVKGQYLSIARFFASRLDKQLIILTTPPLRRLRTSRAAAIRARQLATWLATQTLAPNIAVFNFFDLLANPEGAKHANTLYDKYRRTWPFDSHPNAEASRVIAPLLIEFIAGKINH
ncbi:MAG TPA: hypothetical protein VLE99_00380 [Candidatus Saccharimonadales bacterium]|nr:hypothetical protein [Candidatus Saccharimonadales bacterium]